MRGSLIPTLMCSFLAGAGSVLILSAGSLFAQTTPGAQPLQDFRPQEENTDIFSGRGGNQGSGVMNIIHRANFGNIRSLGEFRSESNQNVLDAAAQFREQQRRAIEQRKLQPTTPQAAPTSNSPESSSSSPK